RTPRRSPRRWPACSPMRSLREPSPRRVAATRSAGPRSPWRGGSRDSISHCASRTHAPQRRRMATLTRPPPLTNSPCAVGATLPATGSTDIRRGAFMGVKRALVVDDSKSARTFLSRILEKYDIDVDSAESAEQAIEYLGTHRPDVIFMDHLMPGMDGFQAVQAIKNNPRTAMIPIMMYTSQEG